MIRLLEENKSEPSQYWISNEFLEMIASVQVLATKEKETNKITLNFKLPCSKGHSDQSEKAMYRVVETICKIQIW